MSFNSVQIVPLNSNPENWRAKRVWYMQAILIGDHDNSGHERVHCPPLSRFPIQHTLPLLDS